MNAVALVQPNATPAVPAFTMNEIERVAEAIARGGLFGSKDPYAVLTLCMLAQAEGQHPAVVFRDYHIISGKPSKKAEAMQRDFLMAGGKIEWHRLDDECADATFSHPTGGSARISWDKARVKQAQLGGNAMHSKYPRQMLRARVISEGVRTVFPGATSGLYVPDEVAAFDDKPSTPPTPQAQRARDLKADHLALGDKSAGRQKAEDWAREHIEAIENAATPDDLDEIVRAGAKARARLEKEHPDLAERVAQAQVAKFANDGALSPDNPTAAEGPADEQRGEAHGDDRPPTARQFADAHIGRINAAETTTAIAQLAQDYADDLERLDTAAPAHRERIRAAERARWEALNGGAA